MMNIPYLVVDSLGGNGLGKQNAKALIRQLERGHILDKLVQKYLEGGEN
jgi:uncharacterized protein (UPF0297 family)